MNTTTQSNRRKARVRARITGTQQRPRLAIKLTNRHVTAQIIDDTKAHTLAYVTTVRNQANGNLTERATWVGAEIAKTSKKHKITKVVFDRGDKQYHGRLHALAEAARQGGLEF